MLWNILSDTPFRQWEIVRFKRIKMQKCMETFFDFSNESMISYLSVVLASTFTATSFTVKFTYDKNKVNF